MATQPIPTLQEKLNSGQTVRTLSIGPLANANLVEIIALEGGTDGVWFDQEHAAISYADLAHLLRASRACALDAWVRIAPTDYATAMRPFELGASGLMAAQVRDPAQARQIAQWTHYPPQGERGLFAGNWEARYGQVTPAEHTRGANRRVCTVIQIETEAALQTVEAIAELEGIDGLFVGTGDLACALGVAGEPLHPKCIDALRRVSCAASAKNKFWGAQVRNAEHARQCRDLDCRLFSLTSDFLVVRRGLQAIFGEFETVLAATQ